MKKISRLAAISVLLVSLGVPLFASAVSCPAPDCFLGGSDGICHAYSTGTKTETYCNSGGSSAGGGGGGGGINTTYLTSYKTAIVDTVNNIIVPVLIAIAFIVFLFGVFRYFIYGATNESEKAEGRNFAMWGIIGFVIIISVWGLVNIVKDTLIPSGANSAKPNYPKL